MIKADKRFVHLHLHTDFSLLDGAIKIAPLAKRAAELEMSAVAITDHGNLYGALNFYHKMRDSGVKPIIGIEAYYTRGSRHEGGAGRDLEPGEKATNHLVLLARDLEGYRNLVKLSSLAFTEGFWRKPRIDRELLAAHSGGLIGLSACLSGVPPSLLLRDRFEEAARAAKEFEEILGVGNYYLEIQEHGLDAQRRIRRPLVELSRRTAIPLVATNDSHYLMEGDVKAHDTLLCIGTGRTINDPNRLTYGSPKYYFRSADEMWEVFGEEPQLLLRTLEIAEKCDLTFPKVSDHLPVYAVPEGQTIETYFEKVTRDGFDERMREVWATLESSGSLKYSLSHYRERLDREIETIRKMGFAGYFLIVWDFIRFARDRGIPVGPGRGSAAGSLVAYCLRITDVDPLQYDLLFERFLNPERVSMPDIDVDFCVRGRSEVIEYVSELYGRQNVAQIITFGTMASRAAIKDVGRALELPYAEVERVAKMIPPPVRGRNVSIEDAIRLNEDLSSAIKSSEKIAELITIARQLEGCARHTSVHAAGVVISPRPIHELVPVCRGQNNELTTQFVMSDLEKTGMLKMDFLNLTTLTIIEDCLRSIERESGSRPDLKAIPLDDGATWKLFAEGHLHAVFQFESAGMVEICRKLKPEGLEDLSALNALYRPGPLDGGMIDAYIESRHGRRRVTYIVPQMKPILENTYGVLVYQEQIMLLAQQLAGYSLGEADLMRRAMGKKKKDEMALHADKFIRGAMARGIKESKARAIYELMAKFADYGFNRSHSFAYAYLAYQTAYLKAHYPTHFFAAVLSNEIDNTIKVARYISEMKHFGIALLPPDINSSGEGFTAVGLAVRFGLAAIKGIGGAAVAVILRAREEGGAFASLEDFVERVDLRAINKRVVESLVKAGAFDKLDSNRAAVYASIDRGLEAGARAQRDRSLGQVGLFGAEARGTRSDLLVAAEPWSWKEHLAHEKEALGFYVSGHPLADHSEALRAITTIDSSRLSEQSSGETVVMGGIITDLSLRNTKKGDRFALFRLEDQFGAVKVVVWPEPFGRFKRLLAEDQAVVVRGRLEVGEEGNATVIAGELQLLERARMKAARGVKITIPAETLSEGMIESLAGLIGRRPGLTPLVLELRLRDWAVVVRPHQLLRVDLTEDFTSELALISRDWAIDLLSRD
jgi:DNA polymerase-3 subunit alpha